MVNGLIYFINRGAESGSIRFDGEEPDVRALLDEACLEVVQEDPLGAYAVEYIKYNVAPIVGSYEADVHITYRRSREQVAAITDATGASAIRSELSEALAAFSPEVVLRISYFEETGLSPAAGAGGLPLRPGLRPGNAGGGVAMSGERAAQDRGDPADLSQVPGDPGEPAPLPPAEAGAWRRVCQHFCPGASGVSGQWPEHTTRQEAPPP
ncbi:MAG: hypothetical protein ACLT5P_08045 [Flavonifractor plautii]